MMITVRDLVKEYRVRKKDGGFKGLFAPEYQTVRAVDGISFDAGEGEMLGLIGPNGAGKSTTLKMLTSILTPTSGEVTINGLQPSRVRKEYVRSIGAMFGQKTQLWWDLPLEDSFLLLKDMFDVEDAVYRRNMELFKDVLEIDGFLHQPVRQLSLGQRVRGDLAAVLLHNPKVVFLDEPTLGLDFVVKKRIREFLREINRRSGTTLVLTSHDIADIESLCERVIILNRGKIAYSGTLDALRSNYGRTRRLDITFAGECPDFDIPGATLLSSNGNRKSYAFEAGISPSALIASASAAHEIANISIIEPEIEEIISEIYREEGTV